MGSGRLPDPSPNDMGTIARAGGIFWFLWRLSPGETFTVARASRAANMTWRATKYQLEMLSLTVPIRQNPDKTWQLLTDDELDF